MAAVLTRMEDPRDSLDRARLSELVRYARANGLTGISSDMPAILIRRQLRDRGLTRINVPPRTLGHTEAAAIVETPPAAGGSIVDAEADLARQFEQQQAVPTLPYAGGSKNLAKMSINELRAECRRLGIKLSRRDNMITMRAKIDGQDAS